MNFAEGHLYDSSGTPIVSRIKERASDRDQGVVTDMTKLRDDKKSRVKVAVMPRSIAWRTEGLSSALLAATLGAVIIFGVGFVNAAAVHNAAHDTRHAVSFPCH